MEWRREPRCGRSEPFRKKTLDSEGFGVQPSRQKKRLKSRSTLRRLNRMTAMTTVQGDQQRAQRVFRVLDYPATDFTDRRLGAVAKFRDLRLAQVTRDKISNELGPVHKCPRYRNADLFVNRHPYVDAYQNPDMETLLTFGARLRWARTQAKLTQKQLASAAKVTQATLSEIETGGIASSGHTPTFASILKVSALWLQAGKGPVQPGGSERQKDLEEAGGVAARFIDWFLSRPSAEQERIAHVASIMFPGSSETAVAATEPAAQYQQPRRRDDRQPLDSDEPAGPNLGRRTTDSRKKTSS